MSKIPPAKKLFKACLTGNLNKVKYLVECSAKINAKNKNYETPLCIATKYGYYNIVKYLVNNGADINIITKEAHQNLFMIIISSKIDTKIKLKMIKYFVKKGLKLNQVDRYSNNLLFYACIAVDFKIVKYLVENKIKINNKNCYHETPIMYAFKYKNYKIIKYLVENGADINVKYNYNYVLSLLGKNIIWDNLFLVKYLSNKCNILSIKELEIIYLDIHHVFNFDILGNLGINNSYKWYIKYLTKLYIYYLNKYFDQYTIQAMIQF